MGICVALRTETGENREFITDEKNLFHNVLPKPYTDLDSMIGWIDWYGNTVFNRPQMKHFLEDWDRLAERVQTAEEKGLLAAVRALAVRCEEEVHLYLWFIGD